MSVRLPTQFQLDKSKFPDEPWARELVEQVNQFVIETIRALASVPDPKYRLLNFMTGAVPAASFPMNFPVDEAPKDIHLAFIAGAPTSAVTVIWSLLTTARGITITEITGLAADTNYVIRLSLL